MLISGIWSYLVLELLFVAVLVSIILYVRNRRLRAANTRAFSSAGKAGPPTDDYPMLLQKQILKAESKLAQLGDTDDALAALVSTHLELLQAEHKAIDESRDDDDKFWALLGNALKAFLPAEDSGGNQADQSAVIASLQTRISAYEQRISNLEKFKENFFALKLRNSEAAAVNQRLHDEVEKAIPAGEQSPELQEAMRQLKDENVRLEQELSTVEQEFDGIMRKLGNVTQDQPTEKPDIAVVSSVESIGEKVGVIKDFVSGQDQQIKALNHMISELQLELEDKQRLQGGMDELEAKNKELNDAVDIIQEENDFLQEQISALLKQELESEKSSGEELSQLKTELEQQRNAHTTLETKYAEMETEYLSIYEENRKLKGQN